MRPETDRLSTSQGLCFDTGPRSGPRPAGIGPLQAGLGKLDLVTREEFEVQKAVLRRTREKLEALERQLDAMDAASRPASPDTRN